MLELIIVTIILLLGFIVVAWYARYRSQLRSQAFELKTRITEPTVDNDFGHYLDEQLDRQEQYISDDLESVVEQEPKITLSSETAVEEGEQISDINSQIIDSSDITAHEQQAELDLTSSSEPFISPKMTLKTDETNDESLGTQATATNAKANTQKDKKAKDKEWDIVIALTILSANESAFMGNDIRAALTLNEITPGEMQIYHRHTAGQSGQTLFSVANLLAPGTLKPDKIDSLETKGLVIFMRLPSPVNGLLAFDAMLNAADKIAKQLNGQLCDEKRRTLTEATLEDMRSRILNFNLSQQLDNNQFKHDYSR